MPLEARPKRPKPFNYYQNAFSKLCNEVGIKIHAVNRVAHQIELKGKEYARRASANGASKQVVEDKSVSSMRCRRLESLIISSTYGTSP